MSTPRTTATARTIALLIITALIALLTPGFIANAAGTESSFNITKEVRGAGGTVPTYAPGDTFIYDITLSCTVIETGAAGCINATLTDPLPDPLEFDLPLSTAVDVVPASNVTVTPNAATKTLSVLFTHDLQDGLDNRGLPTGESATVSIRVKIPDNLPATQAGVKRNTATLEGDNSISVDAYADINLNIPTNLASTVTKSADDHTPTGVPIPAVPGQPVTYQITGTNTSNTPVDGLTLRDPASGNPFEYLAVTGISTLTPPAGADRVQLSWRDSAGTWTDLPAVAIPANPNDLLATLDLADVYGVAVTFTATDATEPHIPIGGTAALTLETETRPNVSSIPDNSTITVSNTASSQVHLGADSSTPATQNASVDIHRQRPSVNVTKDYTLDTLPSGGSTRATIRATVGPVPVTELVISEPQSGQDNFADQGIEFGGFFADGSPGSLEWPSGATAASIQYLYDGFTEGPKSTTTTDTLPAPTSGHTVLGYTVTFTGTSIPANAYAVLPFTVTALPVTGTVDVTTRNNVAAVVTATDGQVSDEATGYDDLTRQPLRIIPTTTKSIIRDELPASGGASTLVSIHGQLDPSSSTGTQSLIITDPANPTGTSSEFYDRFDLTAIPNVAIPVGTTLTIRYWDGATWQVLAGAEDLAGGTSWSHTLTPAERAAVQGIQFDFRPVAPATELSPGFQVLPYLRYSVRSTSRGGQPISSLPGDIDVENEASTTVHNPNAIDPTVSVTDDDDITLVVYPPGTGPDLVDKTWLSPTTGNPDNDVTVQALTDQQRTARLLWSTGDLTLDQMTITDPATPPNSLTGSIYDAFDLVRIAPITPTTDPAIAFDRVREVWRYNATSSSWENITATVCNPTSVCDGQFPGWTVPTAERSLTLGVRLVLDESPTRASRISGPTDPPVGSGVASSDGRRPIDLTFQLRNYLRSDATKPVLGTAHDYQYNSGTKGVVDNTVRAEGLSGAETHTTTDSEPITILDTPITVSLTKNFDGYQTFEGTTQVATPPSGTAADLYPLLGFDLVATNTSTSKIEKLTVTDPDPALAPSEFFERFNLQQIANISVPAGATGTVVTLTYSSGSPTTHTIAEATALTESALENVVGIKVEHTGWIDSGASTTVSLVTRLRATERTSGNPVATVPQATNHALAQASSPGGTDLDDNTATDNDTVSIVSPTYGVNLTKTIDPTSRPETNTTQLYSVQLRARPTGTVRTTNLSINDEEPTFWNAYQLNDVRQIQLPNPLRPGQVRLHALSGVTYALESGDLVARCAGDLDLTACWHAGSWQTTNASGQVTPDLSSTGVTPANVRGLRLEVRKNATYPNWERPQNPQIPLDFRVLRRTNLLYGPGGSTTTEVPSTLPTLDPAPGETVRGTATNVATTLATGSWLQPGNVPWTATDNDDATITKTHLVNRIRVTKTPTGSFSASAEIPYQITITNEGDWPMTGLVLTDQVQTDGEGGMLVEPERDVDSTDPIYTFTWTHGGAAQATTGFSASYDQPTGLISITLPAGFVFGPGDVITVGTKLMFRTGLSPLTDVENTITATSDRIFDRCRSQTHGTNDPNTTNVTDCASTAQVTSDPGAPIRVTKAVKGVGAGVLGAAPGDANYDDLGVMAQGAVSPSFCSDATNGNAGGGYYRTPCLPITRAGATTNWRIQFTNFGNVNAGVISAIDVLPQAGDTAILNNSQRGSRWYPTLLGNFQATVPGASAADIHLYYLTTTPSAACNSADIRHDTAVSGLPPTDTCYANVTARNWQPLDEGSMTAAQIAAIKAIKLVVRYPDAATGGGLAPGGTATLTFDMKNPATAARASDTANEPIAWNSVAAGSRGIFGGNEYRVNAIEPRAVGVGLAMGKVNLTKAVATPTNWPTSLPMPTTYPFRLVCTSDGEPISLVDNQASPVDRSLVQVPADGTTLTVGDGGSGNWGRVTLPLYAQCSIQEDPAAQGATVTYTPAGSGSSGALVALNDQVGRTNVANPALPSPLPVASFSATNTYSVGGFTVSKAVTTGGAVNQDGTPIAYNQTVNFTASCTFNGTQVLGTSDQSFTLSPGTSRTITGVPVGSTCTVTETNAAGAASTSVVLTQGGTAGAPAQSASSSFAITEDIGAAPGTTAAFTNHYTVGSVTVTKAITGDGASAWGAGPFTVRLVCTSPSATVPTVFDDEFTFTPTNLTATVNNLPTGAQCTTTEPNTGGANATTVSPAGPITVGNTPASPTQVTVTNRFDLGSVDVTKEVIGGGSSEYGDGPFTVTLDCTREVGGATVAVTIPGGATRTLTTDPVALNTVYSGLPAGASCALTETVPGGASSSSISVSTLGGAPVVTSGTQATFTVVADASPSASGTIVTMANAFNVGTLQIAKIRTGDGAAQYGAGPFTAQAHCTWVKDGTTLAVVLPDNGEVELSAANGYAATITGIIAGATCYVTEPVSGGAHATTFAPAHASDSSRSADVTIVQNGSPTSQASATITNRFDTGSLAVTKARTGTGAAVFGVGPFTAQVTCTWVKDGVTTPIVLLGGGEVTLSAANSYTATIPDIIAGASCHVTETDAGFATATTYTPAHATDDTRSGDVTVVAAANEGSGGPVALGITNRFDVQGFVVTKEIDNGGAVDADGDPIGYVQDFDFTASCTYQGGPELLSATDQAFTLSSVAPGNTKAFSELPLGTACVVSEVDAADAASTSVTVQHGNDPAPAPVVDSSTNFVIGSGSVLTTFTNHYTTGSVAITKEIVGTGATLWGGEDFTLHAICTSPITDPATVFQADKVVSGADPVWTISDLPTGATCTVSESAAGGANETAISDGTTSSPTSVAVTVGDDTGQGAVPVPVTVTNTFNVGSLAITKTVDGPGAAVYGSGPFTVELACTRDVNGVAQAIDVPGGAERVLDASNQLSSAYTDLPVGAQCALTETATGGANSTAISVASANGNPDVTASGTNVDVTIEADDTQGATPVAGLTAAVTNTFLDGSLKVSKVRTGPGVELFGAGPFTAQVTCTWDKDGVATPVSLPDGGVVTLSAANGYEVTVPGVLVGAVCSVTETDAGLAVATAYEPASGEVTVTDNAAEPVTMTITNDFQIGSLSINKSVDKAKVAVDGTATYTITVKNTGAIPAVNLPVTDTLPKGAAIGSVSDDGIVKGRTVTWTVADLAPGASVKFTVTASFAKAGTYVNVVRIPTPDGPWTPTIGEDECSEPTDGTATGCATVEVPEAPAAAGADDGGDQTPGGTQGGTLATTGAGIAAATLMTGVALLLGGLVLRRRFGHREA